MACAVYAAALAALIVSRYASWVPLEVFLAEPRPVGAHTEAWMDWLAIGCVFAAVVNARALGFEDAAQRSIAGADVVLFGFWCALNARLARTPQFHAAMWLHVAGCGGCALWCAVFARRA